MILCLPHTLMGHNESQWSVSQAVMRSWTVYERYNMMPSADTAHYEPHLCPHVPVSGSPGTQLREALDCLSLSSLTRGGRGQQVVWSLVNWGIQSNQSVSYQDHYIRISSKTIQINKGGKCIYMYFIYLLYQDLISYFQCVCSYVSDSNTVRVTGIFVKQIWINSGIQFGKSRHSDNAQAGWSEPNHRQISIDTKLISVSDKADKMFSSNF